MIGPGRTRQGLGPFLAAFAEEAGARVEVLVGRDAARTRSAAEALAAKLGHELRCYGSMESAFAQERLDAVLIASPIASHLPALERALAHGLHILCEKPMIWGLSEASEHARRIVAEAQRQRRHLWINAQWPWTLPAYDQLHPGVRREAKQSFEFLLAPISRGWEKVPDALPHAFSLLQASSETPGQLLAPRFVLHDPKQTRVSVHFGWRSGERCLDVHVELVHGLEVPRPAAYAFDGHWAHRQVSMPSYEMAFHCDGRQLPYPDPSRQLVHDFVRALQQGQAPVAQDAAVQRIEMLETLEATWCSQFGCSQFGNPSSRQPRGESL